MMRKSDDLYCFLILHYLTLDDTVRCIESIESNFNENYKIVVVDNGSNNNTGDKLLNKYKNDSNVKVILNKENMGFSGGNNVGIKYIEEKIKPDFIIMINNDTYFTQKDFLKKITSCYDKYKFAVLGPKIILKNNQVFIMHYKLRSKKEIRSNMRYIRICRLLNFLNLYNFLGRIKRKYKKQSNNVNDKKNNKIKLNVVLHGCCLIFSRKYLDLFNDLNNKTFLYGEEELLYIRLMNNKLISIYNPDLEIHHNEDGSTNAQKIKSRQKNEFVFRHQLLANKAILDEINNVGESIYEFK